MTGKEVCRYIDLVDRRVFIISHAGVDWKPEYAVELEAIDMELAELRRKVDQEHGRKKEERKEERKEEVKENETTDHSDSESQRISNQGSDQKRNPGCDGERHPVQRKCPCC